MPPSAVAAIPEAAITAAITAATVAAIVAPGAAVPAADAVGPAAAASAWARGAWQGDHERKQPANCPWIVFKDYVLVIDANFPGPAREIIGLIHKTTDKPIRFLFDTHWHGDHTGGNGVYVEAGAAIVCSTPCDEE